MKRTTKTAVQQGRRNNFVRRLGVGFEVLEDRRMLAAGYPIYGPQVVVTTPHVYDQTVNARYGDTAIGAEEMVCAVQPWTNLSAVVYGITGVLGGVDFGTLRADLTDRDGRLGNPDGYYETIVAVDETAEDGSVAFTVADSWGMQIPQQGLPLQVELTFHGNAAEGQYRLNEPSWKLSSNAGFVQVRQFGYKNPVITVEVSAEMKLNINRPASTIIWPNDNDVVLANLVFDATEKINVYSLPVLLEGNDGNGVAIDLSGVVEDVELRNVVSGVTVDANDSMAIDGVYQLENFFIPDGQSTWELRVDLEGAASGTRIRGTELNGVDINNRWWSVRSEQADGGGPVEVEPEGRISGNWMEVQESRLSVYEQSGPSMDTAVENERNVLGGIFEAYAEYGDLLVTEAVYNTLFGDWRNTQNGTLWVDTDGDMVTDTIVESGVAAATDGRYVFSNLAGGGYVVPEGTAVQFEFRFDVASFIGPDPTFSAGLRYLQVENLEDGAPVDWEINHNPQTLWTFVENGTLEVSQAPQFPERYLLGGELSEPLVAARAVAGVEAADVTYVGIDVEGDSGSIDYFELSVPGATAPFALATRSGAQTGDNFGASMASHQFVIPEGDGWTVLVREWTKSDVVGGKSGDSFVAVVDNVQARGVTSSNDYSTLNVDIRSPQEVVVMSQITAVTNAGPETALMPLVETEIEIAAMQVTAATNVNAKNGVNEAGPDTLEFVVTTDADASGFVFYNKANPTVSVPPMSVTRVGNVVTVAFVGLSSGPVDTFVESGGSQTLALSARVSPGQFLRTQLFTGDVDWRDHDALVDTLLEGLRSSETEIDFTVFGAIP
ncbi:MAG: hypothetical protein V1926_02045 [Candidatus Peregrinibacteria bacterium]